MADPALIRAVRRRVKLRKALTHRRTLRPLPHLLQIELWYTAELLRLSREVSQLIRARLYPLLAQEVRQDAVSTPIVRVIEGIRVVVGARARTTAARVIRDVELQNRNNLNAQYKSLVGIDIWTDNRGLTKFLNK